MPTARRRRFSATAPPQHAALSVSGHRIDEVPLRREPARRADSLGARWPEPHGPQGDLTIRRSPAVGFRSAAGPPAPGRVQGLPQGRRSRVVQFGDFVAPVVSGRCPVRRSSRASCVGASPPSTGWSLPANSGMAHEGSSAEPAPAGCCPRPGPGWPDRSRVDPGPPQLAETPPLGLEQPRHPSRQCHIRARRGQEPAVGEKITRLMLPRWTCSSVRQEPARGDQSHIVLARRATSSRPSGE